MKVFPPYCVSHHERHELFTAKIETVPMVRGGDLLSLSKQGEVIYESSEVSGDP